MSSAKPNYQRDFLTPAELFYEVTRGRPYQLDPEARRQAGLTPETWRLEVVPDAPPWQPVLDKSFRKEDGTALTYGDLESLFRERPVRCIKTMQCLMDSPRSGLCSNGLWEGVTLRDVITRLGRLNDVRRVFYTGYYEHPKHRFVSSLSISEVLETSPGHTPVFLAFRLNRIVLTNDYRANDSYAERQNNDPDSPMKTLARLDVHAPQTYHRGEPILLRGVAVVGASGLRRVEYWLRKDQGTHGLLDPNDPAWATAEWKEGTLATGPPGRWSAVLPGGKFPDGVNHLDPETGRPLVWPLPFSWVPWKIQLEGLEAGIYEFRVRSVDLNGFAQPEPRPGSQSGIAEVPCMTIVVD